MTLSSVEASTDCWRQGKRKDHLPLSAFYFLIIAIFIGMPSGSLCGGESYNDKIFIFIILIQEQQRACMGAHFILPEAL